MTITKVPNGYFVIYLIFNTISNIYSKQEALFTSSIIYVQKKIFEFVLTNQKEL